MESPLSKTGKFSESTEDKSPPLLLVSPASKPADAGSRLVSLVLELEGLVETRTLAWKAERGALMEEARDATEQSAKKEREVKTLMDKVQEH